MSIEISELSPSMQDKYNTFDFKMKEKGIPYKLTCTGRTIVQQMALYTMGRLPLVEVNRFRWIAGLWLITEEENKKVTWTLNSKHVMNMFDDALNNDCSHAFDIAIIKNGNIRWDLKVDVNMNMIPDYEEAGKIGEECGLTWGGRWKNADYVHFEEA